MSTPSSSFPYSKYKPAYVMWEDAFSIDPWETEEEMHKNEPKMIHAVGFLVHKDAKRIILALNVAADGDRCCTMYIPMSMVRVFLPLDFPSLE